MRVATVDGYQGAEADIVILSFVRGSNSRGVGFLKDMRRLNVALTRSQPEILHLSHNPNHSHATFESHNIEYDVFAEQKKCWSA